MARVFIGVGSNIHPEENVPKAVRLLGRETRIKAISTFYLTEPVGGTGQPLFYNGVVEIETEIPPVKLKHSVLRRIENELGRKRVADKYAARTIDLDMLIYDDLVATTKDLVIPDPQISSRAFLAIPLNELAPDLVLPGSGRPIREVAQALAGHTMQPLSEFTKRLRREIESGS